MDAFLIRDDLMQDDRAFASGTAPIHDRPFRELGVSPLALGCPAEDVEERERGEFRSKRLVLRTYGATAYAPVRGTLFTRHPGPPAGSGLRHPSAS